jgi:hypothetical protein
MYALQAIETRYSPATAHRGSRISAKTATGIKLSIGYPHELSGVNCHAKAAEALARKLNWIEPDAAFDSQYIAGGTQAGYVFVNTGAKS